MANIKIYNDRYDSRLHVYVNGSEVKRINAVDYSYRYGESAKVKIDTGDIVDSFLDDICIELCIDPDSLASASGIIRHAYLHDEGFRNAFLLGIEDILRQTKAVNNTELAKQIGDRIIGER